MTIRSIPTLYKGQPMKSRLEADTAFLLDAMDVRWAYEPLSFLLPDGVHYWPDFFVQDLHLWIECRGYDTEKGNLQIRSFAVPIIEGCTGIECRPLHLGVDEDEQWFWRQLRRANDYLVIKPGGCRFYECQERHGMDVSPVTWLVTCMGCGKRIFVGSEGSHQCRACGLNDGPRFLRDRLQMTLTEDGLRLRTGWPHIDMTAAEWKRQLKATPSQLVTMAER